MSYDVLANPRTGEYGVLRRPARDGQAATIADLYAAPGATVPLNTSTPDRSRRSPWCAGTWA
jgi:hypothetical protein